MSTSNSNLYVRDVALPLQRSAVVSPNSLLKEALEAMTERRLGMACVIDHDGKLVGVFTDGDLRRMLLRSQKPFPALFADDIIGHAMAMPSTTHPDASIEEVVKVMEDLEIWDMPVVDSDGKLTGLLHLHPVVKALLGI